MLALVDGLTVLLVGFAVVVAASTVLRRTDRVAPAVVVAVCAALVFASTLQVAGRPAVVASQATTAESAPPTVTGEPRDELATEDPPETSTVSPAPDDPTAEFVGTVRPKPVNRLAGSGDLPPTRVCDRVTTPWTFSGWEVGTYSGLVVAATLVDPSGDRPITATVVVDGRPVWSSTIMGPGPQTSTEIDVSRAASVELRTAPADPRCSGTDVSVRWTVVTVRR